VEEMKEMMDFDEDIDPDVAAALLGAKRANQLEAATAAKRQKKAADRSKKMAAEDPDVPHNPFEVSATHQPIPSSFVLTSLNFLVQDDDKAASGGKAKGKADKQAAKGGKAKDKKGVDKTAKGKKGKAKVKATKGGGEKADKSSAKTKEKPLLNEDGTLVDGEEDGDDGDTSEYSEDASTGEGPDDGTGLGFGPPSRVRNTRGQAPEPNLDAL